MRVSNKLVKYVVAVGPVCMRLTATVLMILTFFSISETCVYEVVCEEWLVPFSVLGIILLVAATVSGWGAFILFG